MSMNTKKTVFVLSIQIRIRIHRQPWPRRVGAAQHDLAAQGDADGGRDPFEPSSIVKSACAPATYTTTSGLRCRAARYVQEASRAAARAAAESWSYQPCDHGARSPVRNPIPGFVTVRLWWGERSPG
eukprot:1082559-Prymnesium_polylepis.1